MPWHIVACCRNNMKCINDIILHGAVQDYVVSWNPDMLRLILVYHGILKYIILMIIHDILYRIQGCHVMLYGVLMYPVMLWCHVALCYVILHHITFTF